ncbi:MAG: hypothetical protein ACRC6M_05825 [Microcystaceae cyanobacterium]
MERKSAIVTDYRPMAKLGFSKKTQAFFLGILGLALGPFWPQIAQSQVLQLTPTLSRQQNEEFDGFVQRAIALTATTLKKRFATDKNLNQLRVVVIGENNGSVAPLLQITISRQQWLSNKNPEPYIDYFPDSQALLDLQTPLPEAAQDDKTTDKTTTDAIAPDSPNSSSPQGLPNNLLAPDAPNSTTIPSPANSPSLEKTAPPQ